MWVTKRYPLPVGVCGIRDYCKWNLKIVLFVLGDNKRVLCHSVWSDFKWVGCVSCSSRKPFSNFATRWLSLEYMCLFYPQGNNHFWMLLTDSTVSVSCFGCISHLNFILWYLIINRLQILLWQIFAVVDSFVHCDVLFFGYFPFYLQSKKAVSCICVLIRDNISSFCKVKVAFLMKFNNNYLLTESEVFMGKSQTETLPYWPSDSEVNMARPRLEIFP